MELKSRLKTLGSRFSNKTNTKRVSSDNTTFTNRNDLISDHYHFSMIHINQDKEISTVVSKIQKMLQTSHLIGP